MLVVNVKTLDDVRRKCRIDVTDSDSCWLWMGWSDGKGRQKWFVAGYAKPVSLARVIFELSNRRRCGADVIVHSCCDIKCLNPRHMVAVTRSDAMRAAYSRGCISACGLSQRSRKAAATRGLSKLTIEDALAIREARSAGERRYVVAARYGVNVGTVSRVTGGRAWTGAANGSSVFHWRP